MTVSLTCAQANFLTSVIDYWLADMEDIRGVIDYDDPSDVEFLVFISDLRAMLSEADA